MGSGKGEAQSVGGVALLDSHLAGMAVDMDTIAASYQRLYLAIVGRVLPLGNPAGLSQGESWKLGLAWIRGLNQVVANLGKADASQRRWDHIQAEQILSSYASKTDVDKTRVDPQDNQVGRKFADRYPGGGQAPKERPDMRVGLRLRCEASRN